MLIMTSLSSTRLAADVIDANAELGFLLRRVLAVGLQVQVFRELEQPLVRLGVERLVEAPLERFARQLAVTVIHDELIDRFLAQGVDRAVLRCHWHRSPWRRAAFAATPENRSRGAAIQAAQPPPVAGLAAASDQALDNCATVVAQ